MSDIMEILQKVDKLEVAQAKVLEAIALMREVFPRDTHVRKFLLAQLKVTDGVTDDRMDLIEIIERTV